MIERDATRYRAKSNTSVRCHSEVADWIYAEETEAMENLEKALGHPVAIKVEAGYHIEQFEITDTP
jgi:Ribonuclease G/E